MDVRRTLICLVVSTALSTGIWLFLREPIGHVVRGVTATVLRLTGQRPVYGTETVTRAAAELPEDDHIGVLVQSVPENGKQRTRTYVMSLMRWHVNVIVLPALAVSIGRVSAWQRAAIALMGVPLMLTLDGCLAFLYLSLAARRLRGDALISDTFHGSLEHGLAVYATKLLPIVVWALLYLVIRHTARGVPPMRVNVDHPDRQEQAASGSKSVKSEKETAARFQSWRIWGSRLQPAPPA